MKTANLLIVFLAGCLFASGCAKPTGKEVYQQFASGDANKVASFQEAIDKRLPKNLETNNTVEVNLNQSDMVISNNEIVSYYEIFDFKGIKNQSISLTVRSLCDCAGFKKQIVYPVIYLLDKTGTPLNKEIMTFERRDPVFAKYPYHLYASQSLTLPYSGEYYLFIAANNKNIESVAGTVRMSTTIIVPGAGYSTILPLFGSLNVRTHPVGTIELGINSK